MKRFSIAFAGAIVLQIGLVSQAAPQSDGGSALAGNAALKYWQAFSSLPTIDDATQEKIRRQTATLPLDATIKEILTKSLTGLRELHHGAKIRECAWGISIEDGFNTHLGHASPARLLVSLACLHARSRFEEGRVTEAIDDLAAAATLSRHVTTDGTILSLLIGLATDHQVMDTLAAYVPNLDPATLKAIGPRWQMLPKGSTISRAILLGEEKAGLDWLLRSIQEARTDDELARIVMMLAGESEAQAKAILHACGGTKEGVLKHAEQIRPLYRAMAEKMDVPLNQFEKEFTAFSEENAKKNPIFKPLFPSLTKYRQAQARHEAKAAMLKAAIAIQIEGASSAAAHRDPFGSGPFEYTPFDGGFELKSKLLYNDKPVTLTVGKKKS